MQRVIARCQRARTYRNHAVAQAGSQSQQCAGNAGSGRAGGRAGAHQQPHTAERQWQQCRLCPTRPLVQQQRCEQRHKNRCAANVEHDRAGQTNAFNGSKVANLIRGERGGDAADVQPITRLHAPEVCAGKPAAEQHQCGRTDGHAPKSRGECVCGCDAVEQRHGHADGAPAGSGQRHQQHAAHAAALRRQLRTQRRNRCARDAAGRECK